MLSRLGVSDIRRVLLVGGRLPPSSGGVPRHLEDLAHGLKGIGCQVDILLCNRTTSDDRSPSHYRPPEGSITKPLAPYALRWFARNHPAYDIIHFQGISNPNNLILSGLTRRPGLVFSPHFHASGDLPLVRLPRSIFLAAYRVAASKIGRWIAVSNHEHNLLVNRLHIRSDRIETIHPAVSGAFLPREGRENASKSVRKDPVLLYVGALTPHKHVDQLPLIVRALRDQGVGAKAAIVGYGPEKDRLQRVSYHLDVGVHIDWIDRVSDSELRSLYLEADFVVLPSSQEAYGLVVAEALLMGTPVLVSSCEALDEWKHIQGTFDCGCPFSTDRAVETISSLAGRLVNVGPVEQKTNSVEKCALAHLGAYATALGPA